MKYFVSILLFFEFFTVYSQSNQPGLPFWEELQRRNYAAQDTNSRFGGFVLRMPYSTNLTENSLGKVSFRVLPIISTTQISSNRPYGWGDGPMIPAVGWQQYLSTGFYLKASILHIRFQPEFVIAENRPYEGFSELFHPSVIRDRFHYWNYDDAPERYASSNYQDFWWGQSSVTLRYGSFETGLSTRSIWWGPGQWGGLIFSNNAKSFPHLTFNTIKPAKTFLGNFEGQLLIGKLENSGLGASQSEELNDQYFLNFTGDWRYLNALMISYNPKWIPNLNFGFSRTFQQFSEFQSDDFEGYFPIFEPFQKEKLFENNNSVFYDGKAQDQQVAFFFRYAVPKAQIEIYAEYGRRDHAFNWRDAVLSPEHARAYLFGFQKVFDLPYSAKKKIQLRGEIIHQQESVNRYIRYLGLGGDSSWQLHYQVRSFGNYGQALGTGIGTGSNAQIIEVSMVDRWKKAGLVFHRIENHMDFYNRAFVNHGVNNPWLDYTIGALFNHRFGDLGLSSELMFVHGRNYQWEGNLPENLENWNSQNLNSINGKLSLVYFLNQPKAN